VLSRLDQLPAGAQLTAKVASVLGRSFTLRGLGGIHPREATSEPLRAEIQELTARRFTMQEAAGAEPRYAFAHAITRQVAYDTLLFEQRRELHRRAARWIEDAFASHLEPHLPILALHWGGAEDADRERRYCRLAGQQAAGRYANAEAVRYFTRALELTGSAVGDDERRETLRLLDARRAVYAVIGHVDAERADLERMASIAEQLGDPREEATVQLRWSAWHRRGGRFPEAIVAARDALARLRRVEDAAGHAAALIGLGAALEGQGQFDEAMERVAEALALYRREEDAGGQAGCLKTLGVIHARRGQLAEAMERFVEAAERFRSAEDARGEAEIEGNLGALHYYLGRYEESIRHTQTAQRLFAQMGDRGGEAKCLTNLGNGWNALGRFDRGRAFHKEALQRYSALEDTSGFADSLCNLGIAHEAVGVGGPPELVLVPHRPNEPLEEAAECYGQALALYRRVGSERGEVGSLFNLGSTALCVGDLSTARQHLGAALEQSERLGMGRLAMRCHAALARAALMDGDPEAARASSEGAMALLGDQALPEGEEVCFVHGHALRACGREAEACGFLERARASVRERADRIHEPGTRDAFLHAYAAILEAADGPAEGTRHSKGIAAPE
jgi:tetratricopeptide (TPR) repeat protein